MLRTLQISIVQVTGVDCIFVLSGTRKRKNTKSPEENGTDRKKVHVYKNGKI